MKGKVYNLKIILALLITLTAGFCFSLGLIAKPIIKSIPYSTAVEIGPDGNKEEFSALFDGDIIFSAEKVGVSSEETNNEPNLLTGAKTFEGIDKQYTFADLVNNDKNKTVIDNGGFVMLDNKFESGKFSIETTFNAQPLQEAIMISFGAYIYNGDNNAVTIASNNPDNTQTDEEPTHAGVTYLKVSMKKDNNDPVVLSYRNIPTSVPYFDFTYLITQQEDNSNEGFYKFYFDYMKDGVEYKSKTFEFYMVNKSSYTQTINANNTTYNAFPTLGWQEGGEFAKTTLENGYVRYSLGDNGNSEDVISYPTITYDYIRYGLSYTHTANGKNTVHNFTVERTTNAGNVSVAHLTHTKKDIDGTHVEDPILLQDYNSTNSINLLTIMLTEPGTYVFSYEYLYDGYIDSVKPTMDLPTEEIKLSIHGMNMMYSKVDFEGAKMQSFEIAYTKSNKVDLFIPNGHNINSDLSGYYNKELSFVYNLVEDELNREGSVLKTNSENALKNEELKVKDLIKTDSFNNDYDFLLENIANLKDVNSLTEDIKNVVKNINYTKTNQGPLWLNGNDKYLEEDVDESFYFYGPSKENLLSTLDNKGTVETADDIELLNYRPYTNTTSFNAKGYYLVFINVVENGNTKEVDGKSEPVKYWQIFAFNFTSGDVDVEIKTSDNNVLSEGKYTNKDVQISWVNPGVFDSEIKAYYYYVINNNYGREDLLTKTSKHEFKAENISVVDGKSYTLLGSDVAKIENGNYGTFLIRLESAGEAVAHKIFVIDRQAITGVQAYIVTEISSGNYAYKTDANGYSVPVINAITDSPVTITWNEKASKAKIHAKYSYTPFVQNSDLDNGLVGRINNDWISTNYELGTTIEGMDLYKAISQYSMSDDYVLNLQGIYIIHIWDDAGNDCYYSIIVDQTENFIELNGTDIVSNKTVIYGDNVKYDAGKAKTFELDINLNDGLTDLENFISLATQGKLNTFKDNKYFNGTGNNISNISNYFKSIGEQYYLVVPNKRIAIYNNGVPEKANGALDGLLVYDKTALGGASYYKRTLYIVGENNIYSNNETKDLSYITIEINKDNSRGYVYYSNNKIATESADGVYRLDTGSDGEDENGVDTNGLMGAHATSAKNLAFAWTIGTGNFEVVSVTYKYYELHPAEYNNNTYYFYHAGADPYTIYTTGDMSKITETDGRAIYLFNGDTEITKPGLYEVTRKYKSSENLGDDEPEKNYYFIVDRNGIISEGIGSNIRLELMEGETLYNNFAIHGTKSVYIDNTKTLDKDIVEETYNIYLETNKLPAQIKVPTGKYFDGNNTSADYDAGKLNIQVFFNDINSQFPNDTNNSLYQYRNKVTKIYDSSATFNDKAYGYSVVNGFFVLDVNNYLSNVNIELRDRLTDSKNGTWLFLSGDYIVRITDNVENGTTGGYELLLGFRVTGYQDAGPQVDLFNGYTESDMLKLNVVEDEIFKYSATVSQEYLEVEIPKYLTVKDGDEYEEVKTIAQVDNTYLVVEEFYGENDVTPQYINHPYSALNGINLVENSDFIKINNDGSFRVVLNTRLRDGGIINVENFNIPLYYTIKVRYKLNYNSNDNERYSNCYVYYDANDVKQYFYETTYTICIDREAPYKNIENLNANDNLVQYYNKQFNTETMFENGLHETSTRLHFTKQYAKYYQTEKSNKGYIYVYQVFENVYDQNGKLVGGTTFNTTDVNKVYYKRISSNGLTDLSSYNLTLPFIDSNSYDGVIENVSALDFVGYSGLLGDKLTNNNYYEILEVDKAGNVTQYVIHYNPAQPEITIPLKVTTTSGDVSNIELTNSTDEVVNIFSIEANGKVVIANDNFFKVELKKSNGDSVDYVLTDATTDLENLTKQIVDMFKEPGNYNLVITTNTTTKIIQINLYDKDKVNPLNIEDLVVKTSNGYQINLKGANNIQNNITVFATKIVIKYGQVEEIYIGKLEGENVNYYLQKLDGLEDVDDIINCADDTTYKLTMTDVLTNVSIYRFNTAGKDFYTLSFDEPGDCYQVGSEEYYGFTSAKFTYSSLFTARYYEKQAGSWVETGAPEDLQNGYKQYKIAALSNGLLEIRIDIFDGEIFERTYYITIDTRLGSVALRDYSSGELRDIINIYNNIEFDSAYIKTDKSGTGILNLHWEQPEENEYFKYTYTLYELLNDNTYKIVDLTDSSSYVISTTSESKGVYRFVTSVWSKDDRYLGNRVYAFEVQQVSTEIYYVRNENSEAITSNSSFKIRELSQEIKSKLSGINDALNIPLYISNQTLDVILTDSNSVSKVEIKIIKDVFSVFKISKADSFEIYLATLKINETSSIIKDVYVQQTEIVQNSSITIADNELVSVDIKAKALTYETNTELFSKNIILVDIYHNNQFVKTVEFKNNLSLYGNGDYTIMFRDLAGNKHKFLNGSDSLRVLILKEVPVLINDKVVVDNAYYNEEVVLKVYASTIYNPGSIKIVSCTRNGQAYAYSGANPYVFRDYGTYKVTISATYNNGVEDVYLTKVVRFTIINIKEATASIDLSNLKAHKITKITNTNDFDVTEQFLSILNNKNGSMVTYEDIIKNADRLKVTSGKMTFNVSYSVYDGFYAERSLNFGFTLNNEQPKIECSLKAGETTKKSFKIYFNPAIIYEQIGESFVYINNELVAHITENSSNNETSITRSFKAHGDGDYYVKLVSSSGRIVDSFKVTIKEPLNTWAIIIIVVAVAVVGTVVTVIIVLRRKMRIR